jgi:hypothetical protein
MSILPQSIRSASKPKRLEFPNFPLIKTLAMFSIIVPYPGIHIHTAQEHVTSGPSTKASWVIWEDTFNQAELFQIGRVLGKEFLERLSWQRPAAQFKVSQCGKCQGAEQGVYTVSASSGAQPFIVAALQQI